MKQPANNNQKNSEQAAITGPRKRKGPTYRRWRYSARIKHPGAPLPSAWRIFGRSLKVLWQHKKPLSIVYLFYVAVSLLLVRGSAAIVDNSSHQVVNGVGRFSDALSQTGGTNGGATAYQTVLFIVFSLVIIWSLRLIYANKTKLSARSAFYEGLTPFIPFTLVALVVVLQAIPMYAGAAIFGIVNNSGLAVGFERWVWGAAFALAALWSLWMITGSIFAFYIATLPGVRPVQALRSSHELVRYRRWTVLRKLLFLPLAVGLVLALIIVPLSVVLPSVVSFVVYLIGLLLLFIVHSYYYALYRELL